MGGPSRGPREINVEKGSDIFCQISLVLEITHDSIGSNDNIKLDSTLNTLLTLSRSARKYAEVSKVPVGIRFSS